MQNFIFFQFSLPQSNASSSETMHHGVEEVCMEAELIQSQGVQIGPRVSQSYPPLVTFSIK